MARRETNNGSLRIPVVFYRTHIEDGVDGRDRQSKEVFRTLAEVYNPSNKDILIMNGQSVKSAVTIRIRDPLGAYRPSNDDCVMILDGQLDGRLWDILDIRPDFTNRGFMTFLLGGARNG